MGTYLVCEFFVQGQHLYSCWRLLLGPYYVLTFYRCCIFKAHCSDIHLQSNWGTEATFRGKAYSLKISLLTMVSYRSLTSFHLQIDAHVGGVNDIAFAHPKQLCIVTCGDDKMIKVWFCIRRISRCVIIITYVSSCTTGMGCWNWAQTLYI